MDVSRFAQSEACYTANGCIACFQSHKDGTEPYKTAERHAIQRYTV